MQNSKKASGKERSIYSEAHYLYIYIFLLFWFEEDKVNQIYNHD